MNKCKHLFRGIFNYQNEIHIERCFAYSEAQAKLIFLRRLAERLGRELISLQGLYCGRRDNFKIIREIEFTEDEPMAKGSE